MAILFISTSSKHSNGFHKLLKELSIISAHRLKSVFQPQKSSTSARRPHSCSILFSSAVLPYSDIIPRRKYLYYKFTNKTACLDCSAYAILTVKARCVENL